MPISPVSQKQFVVTLGEGTTALTVTFNKFSAPVDEYGTFEVTDPTVGKTRTYTDFLKHSNITLTKHLENTNQQDDPLLAWYDAWLANPERPTMTVTIQPVTKSTQGTPLPGLKSIQLLECEVVRCQRMSAGDRDGSGSATLELELAIGDIKR